MYPLHHFSASLATRCSKSSQSTLIKISVCFLYVLYFSSASEDSDIINVLYSFFFFPQAHLSPLVNRLLNKYINMCRSVS